ncbi:TetR family transcriptional regulator [Kitasatospora sp. MMS16-BH015]|uniref:TetR/AcrR family transcriptional regulator n=1 Tax=Kitasatospora sp. MMS16-BH015 TaxID=2018025 RepID=UPI000CA38922|nr:TetR/AcrR family transcriptional regulator [Kitasatospora sp. MMS16-BH015]AUG78971.1 TetR family transcriptional regulator [Kitasatospora sp. MMS16-BH015]
MPSHARERLLVAAERLFYEEGIRAVGVERILSESGVGRASFYRHFPGKEDLVVEVLRRRDVNWRAWLADRVERSGLAAEQQALALFDGLAERFAAEDFRGCAFINTMVEEAAPESAAHLVAHEHKEQVIAYLDGLLARAGYAEHEALARQLALLGDGAIVTALREGTVAAASRARGVAEALLGGAVKVA